MHSHLIVGIYVTLSGMALLLIIAVKALNIFAKTIKLHGLRSHVSAVPGEVVIFHDKLASHWEIIR